MKKIALPFLFVVAVCLYLSGCNEKSGDNNKPFIIMNPYNPTYWPLDEPYMDPGAEAFDVTETGDTVDITNRLQVSDNVNVSSEGDYQVRYNVNDEAGNDADEKIREVKVVLTK